MSAPDPTVAEIAGKLTKAGRTRILSGATRGSAVFWRGTGPTADRLRKLKLASVHTLMFDQATERGLAVRAYLMEQAG